jgi:hypothetical protein
LGAFALDPFGSHQERPIDDLPLFRIVYCSRNTIGPASGGRTLAISQIFANARVTNKERNITGALLYSLNFFAQVLEGPQTALEYIFEKIQRDQRHSEVTVLEYSPAGVRDFPAWPLARVLPRSALQAADASAVLDQAMKDPETTGRTVVELLRSLGIQED